MTTEAALQRRVMDYANKRGVFARKIVAINSNGFPDVIMVYRGRVWFIELKNPKGTGRLSALQELTLRALKAHGLTAVACSDFMDIVLVIESEMRNADPTHYVPPERGPKPRDHRAV